MRKAIDYAFSFAIAMAFVLFGAALLASLFFIEYFNVLCGVAFIIAATCLVQTLREESRLKFAKMSTEHSDGSVTTRLKPFCGKLKND